jgi:hypothetical protein
MELLPGARHGHISQFGCRRPGVCISYRLLQQITLGAHFLAQHCRVIFKGTGYCLSACREVAQLLVEEQRSYHRELVNARHPDPHTYSVGDIVFARCAVRLDAKRGVLDKIWYAYTGPWQVQAILKGTSYELVHCDNANRTKKRHASNLSPYLAKLIPFKPVDGADTRYGQLYKPISAQPFKEAGINGFIPPEPVKLASNLAITDRCAAFHWPSLSKLNDELAPFPWSSDKEFRHYLQGDSIAKHSVLTMGPPLAAPTHSIPTVPAIHLLTAAIIKSCCDKLFFLSHSIGTNTLCEWRLVRLVFTDSVSLYPSCTLDGRFLFDFYICYPSDWHYNAVNQ